MRAVAENDHRIKRKCKCKGFCLKTDLIKLAGSQTYGFLISQLFSCRAVMYNVVVKYDKSKNRNELSLTPGLVETILFGVKQVLTEA